MRRSSRATAFKIKRKSNAWDVKFQPPRSFFISVFHYSWLTGVAGEKCCPTFPSPSTPLSKYVEVKLNPIRLKAHPRVSSSPPFFFPVAVVSVRISWFIGLLRAIQIAVGKSRLSFHRERPPGRHATNTLFFVPQSAGEQWEPSALASAKPEPPASSFSALLCCRLTRGRAKVQKWSKQLNITKNLFTAPTICKCSPPPTVWMHIQHHLAVSGCVFVFRLELMQPCALMWRRALFSRPWLLFRCIAKSFASGVFGRVSSLGDLRSVSPLTIEQQHLLWRIPCQAVHI